MGNGTPDTPASIGRMKDIWHTIYKGVIKWFIFPLVAMLLGAMFIGRIVNAVMGPKTYSVYVVGNYGDPGSKQVIQGFMNEGNFNSIDGVPVVAKQIDDRGDPDNARRVASNLASQPDTLMVVGHILSTETKAALPAYLSAGPPVPVILTTETNPDLFPPKTDGDAFYPVYRLSPDDDMQAGEAAKFAIDHGARSFWVVEDSSNPVYSGYLARKFISDVHQEARAKVLLWSTNLDIPPPEAIKALKVDWVFFAGFWENALILIRQLKAILPTYHVLLSDYCMDQALINQGGSDVNGVYLTFQLAPGSYDAKGSGYAVYGIDAHKLVSQLLREVDDQKTFSRLATQADKHGYWLRKFLGIRRVKDARNVLDLRMKEDAASVKHVFDLGEGSVHFGYDDGIITTASFHVWQITNGRFGPPGQ